MSASAGRWAAFQHRDYRLLLGSRFLSGVARQMLDVAVGWLVYDMTESALALGLVGLFSFLPMILFALVTGHVADRFDRRIVMAASHLIAGASVAALFLVEQEAGAAIWPIYGLVFVNGVARAFGMPASQALMPNLVPREHFANAVSWNSSIGQVAFISGPALGGLLYALGAPIVFATIAALFGIATLQSLAIRHRPQAVARGPVTWENLSAGLTFIVSRPVLLGAISLDLVAVLLGGAVALLPIFARDVLHVGPLGLGVLRSMPAVGAVLMALALTYWPLQHKAGLRMLQGVAVFGLATVLFGLSTNLYLSLAVLVLAGAADMISVVVRQTMVQADTPDAMRGRVAAVSTIFVGASNELGQFYSGTVAALIGAVPAVVLGGLGTMASAALWAKLFPALRRRDALVQDIEEPAAASPAAPG